MKKMFILFVSIALLSSCGEEVMQTDFRPMVENSLRAPSYPLITIDPYTCAWLFGDELNGDTVRHWTGKPFPLTGVLRVDKKTYRFMGVDEAFATKAEQKSVVMMPTQTFYMFTCGPVDLELIFTSPLLMDDLDLMTRPVSYVTYQVRSNDGKPHDVQVYFEATDHWAVDVPGEETKTDWGETDKVAFVRTGTVAQDVLGKKGDNVRINWGYFYLAVAKGRDMTVCVNNKELINRNFLQKGLINVVETSPSQDLVLSVHENLGRGKAMSGRIMLGYDDIYSIQFFGDNREAYWKRNGMTIQKALEEADADYMQVMDRCAAFDKLLMADAEAAGGKKYAELCALVYRQAIAAHKLVTDRDGNLLFLSKENFSNGSIGTVDVTYPSSPLFLLYNTELAKGLLNHIFYYSESGQWTKPFPAHDVGTYPMANGQTYPYDMPIEENGNMLILTNAICRIDGRAKYAEKHWAVLTTWADYLLKHGFDPEDQLCTDDFAGHLAHNANLSIKAILGIASYGQMAAMLGKDDVSKKYLDAARMMVQKWVKMADNGDHYRLTFDQKDSWSQKYNLIWDELFGLNLFPKEVRTKELAYYRTVLQPFGLPLDSRRSYTKSDWIMWTACLTDNPDDFEALTEGVYRYCNESAKRVPLTDWHETTDGSPINMRARSVVGGYFMKMLKEKSKGQERH